MAANGTAQLNMNEFLGINYARGEHADMRYATWAENVDTRNGTLKSAPGYWLTNSINVTHPFPDLASDGVIDMIVCFPLWTDGFQDEYKLVATAKEIYAYKPAISDSFVNFNWELLNYSLQGGGWSHAIYEDVSPDNPDETEPVVLLTNAYEGLYAYYTKSAADVQKIDAPDKFGSIAQYNERIFGTGAISQPDRIWYSAPFNPKDWELNAEIPEDGAGFIDYPTWDGDAFIALVPFGADLLAFKRNSLCVITGTNPGEYTIYKTFGTEGPVAKDTICVYRNMVFFLTTNGIGMFDGSTIRTISRDAISHITNNITGYVSTRTAKAVIHNGVYMCAVPYQNTERNNAVIEYDIERGTYMLHTGLYVSAWSHNNVATENSLSNTVSLYMATYDQPLVISEYGYSNSYGGRPIHSVWQSPWTDVGHKESVKSAFRVYTIVQDIGDPDIERPEESIDFSIETERKTKTKMINGQFPHSENQKMLSKPISNKGRQFRWKIEADVPWAISTGIQIETELDSD